MRRSSHSVTQLTYHIVLVTKYRRPVLTGPVEETVRNECRRILEHFDCRVLEIETDVDHIHILTEMGPKYSLSEVMNVLKGVSARIARRDHGDRIGEILEGEKFWSPRYFAATTGGVTIVTLKQYVASQKEPRQRRKKALSSPPKS